MKYFLLSLLFSFYTIILLARDTVLVDEIKISLPVISIINDADGNVFIHTKKIIYQYKNNQLKFFQNCGSEDREMILENGQISFLDPSKPDFQSKMKNYIENYKQNEIWRKYIPVPNQGTKIYVAKDKRNHVFTTSGTNLYKIQLNDNYTILHKNKSIRGIDTLQNKLLVNTYSGIFLDTKRIWPELFYAHGNYLRLPGNKGLLAGNIIVLTDHSKVLKKIRFPNALIGNISFSKTINFENKIWIGSDKGLLQIINDTARLADLPLFIHNLEIIDKKLIASTDNGIYFRENEKWIKLTGFPELSYNGFKKINGLYYGLSSEGLYVAKGFNMSADLKWNKIMDCYELQKDIQNNLWLSTSNGVFRFSNSSDSYEYLFNNIEFNKRSSFKMGSFIYFGSIKGLYKINANYFKSLKNDLRGELTSILNYSLFLAILYLFFIVGKKFLYIRLL
jgi:ligand-binding sensor domain-containing protein